MKIGDVIPCICAGEPDFTEDGNVVVGGNRDEVIEKWNRRAENG